MPAFMTGIFLLIINRITHSLNCVFKAVTCLQSHYRILHIKITTTQPSIVHKQALGLLSALEPITKITK